MISVEQRYAIGGDAWARQAIKGTRVLCLRMKRKYGKRFVYRRAWLQTAWDARKLMRKPR